MKALIMTISLLATQISFAYTFGQNTGQSQDNKANGCTIDGGHIPFVYRGGPFGASTAVIASNIYAEYKNVWNSGILNVFYQGNIIATQSKIMHAQLKVTTEVGEHHIECKFN